MKVENALYMTLVPSPVAHAKLLGVETVQARAAPGVVAVITNADLDERPFPPWLPNADQRMTRSLLADRVVRFVGEPVVAVLATSSAQAADAAAQVQLEFEHLAPVVDPTEAASDETLLFPQALTNTCFEIPREEPDDPNLFAGCEVRVQVDIAHQRIAACPIEPRAGIAVWDEKTGLTYWAAAAEPHGMRERLASVLGVDQSRVRVICPDVGGAFGAKGGDYLEEMLVGVLARKVGRPIRWAETRSESMLGMYHGRAMSQRLELGGLRDGTILAYKIDVLQDAGAYPTWAPMLTNRARVLASGAYAIPRIEVTGRAVVTTTTPVGTVRGAGRPEANIAIERAIDLFASELGLDPVEVRRRNLIAPGALPYTTATGSTYDSGNYPELLRRIVVDGGYEKLRAEQRARRAAADPMLLGIGIGMFVEISDTAPVGEYTRLVLDAEGGVLLFTGAAPQGQGHQTVLAQVVAGVLGVPFEDVDVRQGDTAEVPLGVGTFGSRTAQAAGSATYRAAGELLRRARELAADVLGARSDEVLVDVGRGFRIADGRAVSWRELGRYSADSGIALEVEHRPDGEYGSAWPSGAVIAAVEVDSETGVVSVRSLVTCDDIGVVLNPMIVDGQVRGGLALGVAHALLEEFRYDEDGNPTTTNFGDYPVITADLVPRAQLGHIVTPAPDNDIGAKGVGEAGTVGCPAALLNAVADALGPIGVRHLSPPATPERVLAAIASARRNGG
jgi:carbon-monoxide dehydrogenase large subunit